MLQVHVNPEAGGRGVTQTAHDRLAEEIRGDLEAIAVKLAKLETVRETDDFIRAHVNVPIPFLSSAVTAVEQNPELDAVQKLDSASGRNTLQFLDAFRHVRDRMKGLTDSLELTMRSRQSRLAAQALQIYSIAQGLARHAPPGSSIVHYITVLRRDLGPRGRPRKKPTGDE